MALAPHSPRIIKNATLTLGGTEFSTAVDEAKLTPAVTKTRWKSINGKKITITSDPDWTLNLNLGQDFDTTSLQAYLNEHHGEVVPFELKPDGAESGATGSVTCEATDFGGKGDEMALASVALDVAGKPEFTWEPTA
ncbi:hypothetical protein [Arthrobacter woluwensis]|uniref:hypothetical protein n=1 Tax=Arthrobacter woluwensis TaxID=156980 RepID=UPI00119E9296|nr:hypothetical protein [Arthrobacter woluwensis]